MTTIDLDPSEYRRVPKREKLPPKSSRWLRLRRWLWDVKWVIAAVLAFLGWVGLYDLNQTAGYVVGVVLVAAIEIAIMVRFPWIWALLLAFAIGSE